MPAPGTQHARRSEAPGSIDLIFQALADPTRRSLLERLSEEPASASQLAEPLSISLPAVVQHLQLLEASGLVHTEKVGRVRMCRIEPAALHGVERWIQERKRSWERRFDRLGELLAAEVEAERGATPERSARRKKRTRAGGPPRQGR